MPADPCRIHEGQGREGRICGCAQAAAVDAAEGAVPVAVKALSLRGQGFDWKQLQLFEREAKALESLGHPGIPRYIDYFEVDTADDRGFFLVQVRPGGLQWCRACSGSFFQEADEVSSDLTASSSPLRNSCSQRDSNNTDTMSPSRDITRDTWVLGRPRRRIAGASSLARGDAAAAGAS